MFLTDDVWYCSEVCRHESTRSVGIDHKYEYIKSVIWDGLNQMVRHDAIRQNDGPAMISFWRHDMLQFHQHHHPKYLILGHRLLASTLFYTFIYRIRSF